MAILDVEVILLKSDCGPYAIAMITMILLIHLRQCFKNGVLPISKARQMKYQKYYFIASVDYQMWQLASARNGSTLSVWINQLCS